MNVPDNYKYFFSGNSVKTMLLPLKKKPKKKQKQPNLFIQMTRKKMKNMRKNMLGYFQLTQTYIFSLSFIVKKRNKVLFI